MSLQLRFPALLNLIDFLLHTHGLGEARLVSVAWHGGLASSRRDAGLEWIEGVRVLNRTTELANEVEESLLAHG